MTEAMDCSELRKRLDGNPARPEPAFERHAASCPACRAYLGRLMRAETLIGQALRFDVAAHAAHVAALARPDRGSHWVALTAGLAAGGTSLDDLA